jgi:hypothetical protein
MHYLIFFVGHFPKIKVMYTAEIDGVYQEEVELKTKGRSSYFNQEIQQKDSKIPFKTVFPT